MVLDGEVLMASEKTRPYVVGDGRSSIRTLIATAQRLIRGAGHPTELRGDDVRVARHLAHSRRTLETVPAAGKRVELLPCGNLGVGGDVRVVTDVLHPKLRALAIGIVHDMGLRIASLDLVLGQPSDAPPKRCTVLELNSAPGLDAHEREPGWSRRRVERVARSSALDRGAADATYSNGGERDGDSDQQKVPRRHARTVEAYLRLRRRNIARTASSRDDQAPRLSDREVITNGRSTHGSTSDLDTEGPSPSCGFDKLAAGSSPTTKAERARSGSPRIDRSLMAW